MIKERDIKRWHAQPGEIVAAVYDRRGFREGDFGGHRPPLQKRIKKVDGRRSILR
jgi:hypothetical protein